MGGTTAEITATEALERLEDALDLSNIRMKLADPEEGKGYSVTFLDVMEGEYRKFLALRLAHPEAEIVPCGIVDEMWHQHILDTIAYRDDCDRIFGHFVDHFPYFGMRGDADAQALKDAYGLTLALYELSFGSPPSDTWISTGAAVRCRTQCKPMKCR